MKKYVVTGILVLAILAFAMWKWAFRAAETDVSEHNTDIAINASELVLKFIENEDSANTLYLNKVIEITGIVDTVTLKDQEVSVYLKERDAASGVLCSFDKKSFTSGSLKRGDIVTLKGLCSGYLMDVILNKCSIQSNEN